MDIVDPNTLAAQAISNKGASLSETYNSATFPHDWTEGAGTLPASGQTDIPAPPAGKRRLWLYVQNQGTATLPVAYECRKADAVTPSMVTILLGPGTGISTQGGGDERGFAAFLPQGQIRIGNSSVAALGLMPAAIMETVE